MREYLNGSLEHLIFTGSQEYPYKGILDQVANRCFAQGTNAWTDIDHTVYSLEVAGIEGFLSILPMYLDVGIGISLHSSISSSLRIYHRSSFD
ncbi:peptidase m16 domain-containing protein [Blastocystis sp. subtype 4]|uniref:peptidase m16 domain-containing protein n=1 Tax=Blastocystis sp. subtype 4 TaxID=944170 RepID=UPI0007114E97|nr:peptidase m16 domain-containing protein [Blastocystis sp. subtype 4]KNB44290.1 peptidase m16 domain-containing protein [Blastocystis sp. subtype 4]|eukprot:XP_014527733.1 peptidase m16 domain-containing protein [Blastocystis sp. subtype 4]